MAVRVAHVTLVIDTVSTVTLTGSGNKVKVTVLSAASAVDPVYFLVGTSTVPPANPTLAGNDQDSVSALNNAFKIVRGISSTADLQVKLIAHVAHIVCVELLGE